MKTLTALLAAALFVIIAAMYAALFVHAFWFFMGGR